MAYPFIKAINWNELIVQMSKLGVDFCTAEISGPGGNRFKVTYFQHRMDGIVFRAVVNIEDYEEPLMPSVLRGICKQLRINPIIFGLDLG